METMFEFLKKDPFSNSCNNMWGVYSIDNFPVKLEIDKRDGVMSVFVTSPFKMGTLYMKKLNCVEDLREFVEVDLVEMKFNLLISRFETKRMSHPAEICDLFDGNPNVEPLRAECTVCMEPTFARLCGCHHSLCLRCEVKIIRDGNNRCPVCRRRFYCEPLDEETESESETE